MRPALAVLPFALFAACASPQERCISGVEQNLRINANLIQQTRANIQRGFGVETRQVLRERDRFCRGVTEDGDRILTRCETVDVRTRRVPVALDLDAERAKLESLLERRAALVANRDAALAQCVARFGS